MNLVKRFFILSAVTSTVICLLILFYNLNFDNTPTNVTVPPISTNLSVKNIYCATYLFASFFSLLSGRSSWELWFTRWNTYDIVACEGGYHCRWTPNSFEADALIFHGRELSTAARYLHSTRKPSQRWIFFSWESVLNVNIYYKEFWKNKFNWTATYMRRSHVWTPYFRGYRNFSDISKHEAAATPNLYEPSEKYYFAFAVISNCAVKGRLNVIKSMRRFVKVDMFGRCGAQLESSWDAFQRVSRRYRYYLAFENSWCEDYITEKFWLNGLMGHALPVVFGGRSRRDYDVVAPPKSFVYAPDYDSVKALVESLKRLAGNELEYASYFAWKRRFTVDRHHGMGDDFMCRLCQRLNTDNNISVVDINAFWDATKYCDTQM